MARIFNEILYNHRVADVDNGYGNKLKSFVVNNSQEVCVNDDFITLFGVTYSKSTINDETFTANVDVEKFMREVRDYLEFVSFQEVIE